MSTPGRSTPSLNISMEKIIEVEHLSKSYKEVQAVRDISFYVEPGKLFAFLGPNGAGKSTTIRHLMGFSKPQSGTVCIENMRCWSEQKKIQKNVGYLPGEIAFPDDMTGLSYLRLIAKMRGTQDFSYAEKLLKRFELLLCTIRKFYF